MWKIFKFLSDVMLFLYMHCQQKSIFFIESLYIFFYLFLSIYFETILTFLYIICLSLYIEKNTSPPSAPLPPLLPLPPHLPHTPPPVLQHKYQKKDRYAALWNTLSTAPLKSALSLSCLHPERKRPSDFLTIASLSSIFVYVSHHRASSVTYGLPLDLVSHAPPPPCSFSSSYFTSPPASTSYFGGRKLARFLIIGASY